MNEYTKYGTLRVVFYNKFKNVYDERKQYDYACNPDALQYVNEGDFIAINTPSGISKVKVVDIYWSLTYNVSKEIDYNMTSGNFKEKFNQFNPKTKNKRESKMKTGMKDMMKRFMCEVENVGLNMTDGKTGIKKDGSVFTYSGDTKSVQENMFDFMSFDIPAMGISTPIANVKSGDIIVENGKAIGWVTQEPSEGKIKILRVTGTAYTMTPPENVTMGTKNVMVVKNMFEGVTGSGNGNMMQNMMMMQMMSGEEMDEKKMMMLMMMQNQGGDNSMANMLPMLMMMK